MPDRHQDPCALEALQDSLYLERVRRARGMSGPERFAEGLELTNSAFERMLMGAMWQLGLQSREEGWAEVRQRLERLRRVEEAGRYTTVER